MMKKEVSVNFRIMKPGFGGRFPSTKCGLIARPAPDFSDYDTCSPEAKSNLR
jgi:hypothetical protein